MGPRDRPVTSQRTLFSFFPPSVSLYHALSFSGSIYIPLYGSIFLRTSFSLSTYTLPLSLFLVYARCRSSAPSSYDPYSNDAVARTYRGSKCVVGLSEKEIRVSESLPCPANDIIGQDCLPADPETTIYIRDCRRMWKKMRAIVRAGRGTERGGTCHERTTRSIPLVHGRCLKCFFSV